MLRHYGRAYPQAIPHVSMLVGLSNLDALSIIVETLVTVPGIVEEQPSAALTCMRQMTWHGPHGQQCYSLRFAPAIAIAIETVEHSTPPENRTPIA